MTGHVVEVLCERPLRTLGMKRTIAIVERRPRVFAVAITLWREAEPLRTVTLYTPEARVVVGAIELVRSDFAGRRTIGEIPLANGGMILVTAERNGRAADACAVILQTVTPNGHETKPVVLQGRELDAIERGLTLLRKLRRGAG